MKRKIGIQIFVYWRVWAEVKRALLSRILTLEILYWAVNAEDCALRDVRAGWESCRGAGVPYSPGHCDSARDNTCKSSETSHKGLHRIAKHIFIISIFPLNYFSSFCFIFFEIEIRFCHKFQVYPDGPVLDTLGWDRQIVVSPRSRFLLHVLHLSSKYSAPLRQPESSAMMSNFSISQTKSRQASLRLARDARGSREKIFTLSG